MLTNVRLRNMPDFERHKAIYAALSSAGLHDLIPCRWCCEDCEGCDTAEMLRIVCIEQTGERRVPFTTAVGDITLGFSPRGAIPYPDAAQALLARRTKETNG